MPLRQPTAGDRTANVMTTRGSVAASPSGNPHVAKLYLEIAQLFVAYGKPHVARRRLKLVIDQCGDSAEARESRTLLEALDAQRLPENKPATIPA